MCVHLDDIARATALQKEILANGEGGTASNTTSSATDTDTATASSEEKKGETLIFTESSIIARQSLSVGREQGEGGIGGEGESGEKIEVSSIVDEEALKKAEARKRLKENAPELPVQVTYATRPKKGKKAV
jgi:hypothetical protein